MEYVDRGAGHRLDLLCVSASAAVTLCAVPTTTALGAVAVADGNYVATYALMHHCPTSVAVMRWTRRERFVFLVLVIAACFIQAVADAGVLRLMYRGVGAAVHTLWRLAGRGMLVV